MMNFDWTPTSGGLLLTRDGESCQTPMGISIVTPHQKLAEGLRADLQEEAPDVQRLSLYSMLCTELDFVSLASRQIRAGLAGNLDQEWARFEGLGGLRSDLPAASRGWRRLRKGSGLAVLGDAAEPQSPQSCSSTAPLDAGLLDGVGVAGLTAILNGFKVSGAAGPVAAMVLGRCSLAAAVDWQAEWAQLSWEGETARPGPSVDDAARDEASRTLDVLARYLSLQG